MRLDALRLMRLLRPFRPRLIGSVMTGHVRKGSDIDLHVFSDSVGLVTDLLEQEGYQFDVERKQVVKHGEARVFTHVHVHDRFNFELTVYAEDKAHYVFKSSITGKAIERASIARAGGAARAASTPTSNLDGELAGARGGGRSVPDLPHAAVAAGEREAARRSTTRRATCCITRCRSSSWPATRRPYDEEFLLAALLHDVGKGLDPRRPRRGGAGGAGRPDHRADALPDRAPHGRPRLPGRHARPPAAAASWRRRRTSRT